LKEKEKNILTNTELVVRYLQRLPVI